MLFSTLVVETGLYSGENRILHTQDDMRGGASLLYQAQQSFSKNRIVRKDLSIRPKKNFHFKQKIKKWFDPGKTHKKHC